MLFFWALNWSRTMEAKPSKWRSLAFRKFSKNEKQTLYKPEQDKSYSSFDPCLKYRTFDDRCQVVNEHPIMFVGHDKKPLFKYLGVKLEADLLDTILREIMRDRLVDDHETVEASLLTGPQKAWIVNHMVCQRQTWDLLIHDLAPSEADSLHKLIHAKYRRWIGLAKSAEGSILYRPTNQFGLGYVHLKDRLQQLQVIKWSIMKYSDDTNASGLYKHLLNRDTAGHTGTGRKSTPRLQLEKAEKQVTFDIMFSGQHGKAGLGMIPKPSSDKKERRKLVIAKLKAEANQKRLTILHGYEMQNG